MADPISDMSGKSVLITGASRGIGAEAARVFHAAGANVALVARSSAATEVLAEELNAKGGAKAMAIPCDVSNFAQVEAAVNTANNAFDGLDVFIGNAGVIDPIDPMAEADPAAWGRLIDMNLKGVFYGMRAALPVMTAAGGGTILTVSSGAAHGPVAGWSGYCASKAGAAMLTRSAHLEYGGAGLRIMGLSPGTVATQMQRDIKSSRVDNGVRRLEWDDHIPADWPARALLWMCSAASDGLCGEEISLRDEGIRKQVGLI